MERKMKLTIFAATGGIGRECVKQAIAAGHDVTAVVRNANGLPTDLPTITADLSAPDPTVLEAAVEGSDAVLSGLGPRSLADSGIASRGTHAIVRAMRATGVRRIVAVSAAPVSTVPSAGRPGPPRHDPGDGFIMRHLLTPAIKAILGAHYADLALMEDLLRDSALDWTIVRPPRLTNRPITRTYRTAYRQNVRRGILVSRADVAHFMLRVLDEPATIGEAIGIAR
jgi:putative NADH-flavin reductase